MRLALTLLLTLLAAAPAHAVVGGEKTDPPPWFASAGACGGTLVTPTRVVTAAHCATGRSLDQLGISVAGTVREAERFALTPTWRTTNGGNLLDDVAIVEFAEPVTAVAPVPIASQNPAEARILGSGLATAPGHGEHFGEGFHQATLRVMTDEECAAKFRKARGNDGERFSAPRMVCGIDADGKAPLSSGCNGDSGGPFAAGTNEAPQLIGIVSFGGRRCGEDLLPSVFAEAGHYRGFILAAAPRWAPTTTTPAKVTRRGAKLTCRATGFLTKPEKIAYRWLGGRRAGATHRTYLLHRNDRGRTLVCAATASNDGGAAGVPIGQIKIPR